MKYGKILLCAAVIAAALALAACSPKTDNNTGGNAGNGSGSSDTSTPNNGNDTNGNNGSDTQDQRTVSMLRVTNMAPTTAAVDRSVWEFTFTDGVVSGMDERLVYSDADTAKSEYGSNYAAMDGYSLSDTEIRRSVQPQDELLGMYMGKTPEQLMAMFQPTSGDDSGASYEFETVYK